MSDKKLLIVESPAKAKTITKYLGKTFAVLSSCGHVRGIPSKSNAVDTNHNFETQYEINPSSKKYLDAITEAAKNVSCIYMATDPDREGEAISWHVIEILKDRKVEVEGKTHRITFNEVTQTAIKAALKSPRDIDMNLVAAQRTRQSLDYLVGFSISPILWRKLPGSKSAGRVQSVALKLLCEREHEIIRFNPIDYWTISGAFEGEIKAELSSVGETKIDKFSFKSEEEASSMVSLLQRLNYSIASVEEKELSKNPEPPFITSTLIQAASTALKMSSKKTMQIAQKLYEGMKVGDRTIGLITYMRTDSVNLSEESVEKCRNLIKSLYGEQYLPKEARLFKKKVKSAQEAHEAIRPTDPSLIPSQIKEFLSDDEFALYNLIWKRFVACQMAAARIAKTTIKIEGGKNFDQQIITDSIKHFFDGQLVASFKAIGTVILFDGFQKIVGQTKDDDIVLPKVTQGAQVALTDIQFKKHTTTAPSRYSEASLVKKMEDLGIGRPSTYATIISILQERNYVSLKKNKFFVEDRGELVNTFINCFFGKYVEYGFTASLEDELDEIASGTKNYLETLKEFWEPFKENVDAVSKLQNSYILEEVQRVLNEFLFEPNEEDRKCPKCSNGELKLKNSKYSPFIGCSNYPECDYAQKFKLYNTAEDNKATTADDFIQTSDVSMVHSGNVKVVAEEGDEQIMLNNGKYGPYLSLCKEGVVQKNFALPAFIDITNSAFTFQLLRRLFDMPFKIGDHPDGQEIKIGIGKYGPYVLYKKKFYAIKNNDIIALLNYPLQEAINLISSKK